MTGFVIGVLSSLAATVLTLTAGWFRSSRMRQWSVRMLSMMTGLGIHRSTVPQRIANLDLAADLAKARWVKVLTGRGNELTRDSFRQAWNDLESVQILLPDPRLGPDSFLADREAEIRRHDPGFKPGLLAKQVSSNIDYISTIMSGHENVELRLYDLQNICRIIVTDRVAYFTIYRAGEHGRHSPCMVFSHPGPLYEFALRMFTVTWSRAVPVSDHSGPDGTESLTR
jgi:hypothetical protein